jgi:hypothetical protein
VADRAVALWTISHSPCLSRRRKGQKDYFPKSVDKPVPPVPAYVPVVSSVVPAAAAAVAPPPAAVGIVLKLNGESRFRCFLVSSQVGPHRQEEACSVLLVVARRRRRRRSLVCGAV